MKMVPRPVLDPRRSNPLGLVSQAGKIGRPAAKRPLHIAGPLAEIRRRLSEAVRALKDDGVLACDAHVVQAVGTLKRLILTSKDEPLKAVLSGVTAALLAPPNDAVDSAELEETYPLGDAELELLGNAVSKLYSTPTLSIDDADAMLAELEGAGIRTEYSLLAPAADMD